jgi:hypothetical protein
MNEQSRNYTNALTRKYGTEKEFSQIRYGLGLGKTGNTWSDSRYAKDYGRELLEGWLNEQFPEKAKRFRFMSFRTPEWPNPPLDCCDESGKIILYTKYTSHRLRSLDTSRMRGIALPEWIRENCHLAIGREGLPGEKFFKYALTLYIDKYGDSAIMGIGRSDAANDGTRIIAQTTGANVHFGKIQSAEEHRQGIDFNFDDAWFYPFNYWFNIGRVPAEKMVKISSSYAHKQAKYGLPIEPNFAAPPILKRKPLQEQLWLVDAPTRSIYLD